MALTERLALLITADANQAVRELRGLERQADRSLGTAEERIDRMGARFTKVGAGMLTAGGLAAAGLVQAASATSDLNESVNLTGQVFEDASGAIDDFVKDSARGLGLSERAARDATAQYGLLLTNMGLGAEETVAWSKELTTLAADMGSAFNVDTADAVLAIGAGLRGESEPLRRFGVFLDDAAVRARAVEMGLAATSAEVDNHGKAQARLALIMEQSSAIQGDFARTSDGMANSQKVLAAEFEDFQAALGQGVLPVITDLLGKGNSLLGWFNSMDESTQATVSSVAAYGTAVLIAGGATATLTGKLIAARAALAGMSTAAAGVGAAVATATGVFLAFDQAAQNSRKQGGVFAEGLLEDIGITAGSAQTVADFSDEVNKMVRAFNELDDAQQENNLLTGGDFRMEQELEGAKDAMRPVIETAMEMHKALVLISEQYDVSADEAAAWASEQLALGVTFKNTDEVVRAFGNSAGQIVGQVQDAADATASLEEASRTAADATKELNDILRAQFDPAFAARRADLNLQQANQAVTDAAVKANQEGWTPENAQAYRDAVFAAGEAALDYEVAAQDLQAAVEDNTTAFDEQVLAIQRWQEQGLISALVADGMVEDLARIQAQALLTAEALDGVRFEDQLATAIANNQSGANQAPFPNEPGTRLEVNNTFDSVGVSSEEAALAAAQTIANEVAAFLGVG